MPDAIPPERLAPLRGRPPKLLQYPGLKEEYYLADFEPDPARARAARRSTRRAMLVVLRPPPDVSLYHRHSNPLFPMTLEHLGRLEDVHAVVLPRTEEQREYVRALALPSVIVPERAVDAQSLIALADLVVSAGGTMNREAAALGVPVYTTYGGRLGGVDEELIREGRLRPLTDPRALELRKRDRGRRTRRAATRSELLALLLSALGLDFRAPTSDRSGDVVDRHVFGLDEQVGRGQLAHRGRRLVVMPPEEDEIAREGARRITGDAAGGLVEGDPERHESRLRTRLQRLFERTAILHGGSRLRRWRRPPPSSQSARKARRRRRLGRMARCRLGVLPRLVLEHPARDVGRAARSRAPPPGCRPSRIRAPVQVESGDLAGRDRRDAADQGSASTEMRRAQAASTT